MALKFQLLGGPFEITQGDQVVMNMTAVNALGNPTDLSAATFSTQIKGPNGVIDTFDNSHHSVVSGPAGTFSLNLAPADTSSLGAGANKDIITQITIAGVAVFYRGQNILMVDVAEPLQ